MPIDSNNNADCTAGRDVFVGDRLLGTTERVNLSSLGDAANTSCFLPDISADGRYVCFSSTADNLVPSDANLRHDIVVRDRLAGTTERVSIKTAGIESNAAGLETPERKSNESRCRSFT